MIKATIKIGGMTLTADCNDVKQAFQFNTLFCDLPKHCDNCQSPDIELAHKNPQGNDYYMIKCTGCGATGNFGQRKEGNTLYWKWDTKMEKYTPGADKPATKTPAPQQDSALPF